MFINLLKQSGNVVESAPFASQWNSLVESEKTVLKWFALLSVREKQKVDELGVGCFGPYYYFSSMNSLRKKTLISSITRSRETVYSLPREVDRETVRKIIGTFRDVGSRQSSCRSFDLLAFRNTFCFFLNRQFQGKETPACSPFVILNDVQKAFFHQYAKKFATSLPAAELDWLIRYQVDDVLEELLLNYFSKVIFQGELRENGKLLVKKSLYGWSIPEKECRNLTGSPEEKRRLEEDPFFVAEKTDYCVNRLGDETAGVEDSFHLHGEEFVFPLDIHLGQFWKVLLFGEITSVGQRFHIRFTAESIKNGKALEPSPAVWQAFLAVPPLKTAAASLTSLWQEEEAVLKKGQYSFYEINAASLRAGLTKEAAVRLGEEHIVCHESGVFIAANKQGEWEKWLQSLSITLGEAGVALKAREEIHVKMANEELVPKEWQEVNRLSEMTFQLMAYKENMTARLIRQSQALKLPVIVENHCGRRQIVEVKSLMLQAGSSYLVTYSNEKIPLAELRRIALVRPDDSDVCRDYLS
ncbi:hypothetical protein SAMN05421736_103255 [Evansella caseinilytica]|uniref:Uncharacterized protein n=1 Tax=Evansella caseinilytica TaxID=1503961 RepID=A0A1H3MLE1_9BACI|nr:hypothetical protein [Evansella caseinilytica]SDY76929.1 hypothetical protein SAMN05421736_103255 [Evansella caseinilytica]